MRVAGAQRQNGIVPHKGLSRNLSQPCQSEFSLDAASKIGSRRQTVPQAFEMTFPVAETVSLVSNEAASFEYLELTADVDEILARSCNGYCPDSWWYWRCCHSWLNARTLFHHGPEDDEAW